MKTNHLLLAMTFMSLFLFGTSLFAQQEVDPTWYDPWSPNMSGPNMTAPNATAAKASAPKHATAPSHAKNQFSPRTAESSPSVELASASRDANSASLRANKLVGEEAVSQVDRSHGCYPGWTRSDSQMSAFWSGNDLSSCSVAARPFLRIAAQQMASFPAPQL